MPDIRNRYLERSRFGVLLLFLLLLLLQILLLVQLLLLLLLGKGQPSITLASIAANKCLKVLH